MAKLRSDTMVINKLRRDTMVVLFTWTALMLDGWTIPRKWFTWYSLGDKLIFTTGLAKEPVLMVCFTTGNTGGENRTPLIFPTGSKNEFHRAGSK